MGHVYIYMWSAWRKEMRIVANSDLLNWKMQISINISKKN